VKPTVKYGPCPICDVDTWSVHGPDGDHWMCTSSQIDAINYAAERSTARGLPGTGVQVQVTERASNA
jgi:hypothetical protein